MICKLHFSDDLKLVARTYVYTQRGHVAQIVSNRLPSLTGFATAVACQPRLGNRSTVDNGRLGRLSLQAVTSGA